MDGEARGRDRGRGGVEVNRGKEHGAGEAAEVAGKGERPVPRWGPWTLVSRRQKAYCGFTDGSD